MAEKSRNNGKLNFILLVLAIVGAALFYGCGGVNSDIVPEAQCLITGTIKPSATLESYLLSSLRGVTADMSGCKVWVEADGYGSAVYTDENGNYTITTRPTSSRIVAEYASTNGNTYIVWSKQQSFVRKADTNQVDNMTLKIANISIKGRIISSNGASVSGSNAGVSILGKTIYPDENGIYTLPLMPEDSVETLTISGGGYQTITQTVTFSENSPLIENTVVTNSETNRAPVITSISNKSQTNIKKQQTVLLQVNFSDPDLNIATWSWSVMPSDGASIGSFTSQEGDRSLTYSKVEWRAPDNDALATITFTVTDTKGLTAKSLFFFNIGNGIPNNPPQILSINKVRTSEGADEDDIHIQGREKYTFTALAYDADAEDMPKLRYSWKCEYNGVDWTDGFDTEKNGATSASTIDFIAKGATQTNRIATVTVGVYDGKSSWIFKSQQYIVTQEEANSAPVITLATITAYTETKWPKETSVLSMNGGLAEVSTMSKYRINVVATDANGDKLRYYFSDTATGTNNREEIKAEYEGLSDKYIPSTIWTAPRYASNELLLATITIKVCDEDSLDSELTRSETIYNLNVKIASNPAKIKAPYIKFGDFAGKWGKKGEQATFTAEIHEENEAGPAKQLKQYKWRYIYRADQVTIPNDANEEADGDGKTTWKNIITTNNGWEAATYYKTPLNCNATFTEKTFDDAFASEVGTGTYFVKLIIQDTEGLFTSKVATFTINASPTVSLEVIGITAAGNPPAPGGYNPTSNIWVVNEGCGVVSPNADNKGSIKVRATIRDNSYDTQHKAYFTYGNASYTVNVGNSGVGIVRTTDSNGTVATVEYTKEIADSWNVTAGNNITIEASAQEHASVNALEEIAATATVDVYYNKKPDVGDSPISISDSLIQYEGYNCYIVGRDASITAILTSSDDVDGDKLGYGRGRVVWKIGSINAAGNVTYGYAIPNTKFEGSPEADRAGTVTFTDFSEFGVGTYTLRAEITDSYGAVNVATSPTFIVAKDSSIAFNPTPSIPANVDLNNNTNPTYVTYGTSFKMQADYTVGGANGTPANVEYKYKLTTADDSQYANFTSTSVTQDPLSPTVSASINTTGMAASYSYNVSVVATGNHGEVASAAYTIMLNTPPATPKVILNPDSAPAVNNGIYASGTTFALKATINDPEDFQDMTVHTIKASEAPTGAKLEFWYSTDDGAHTTKINSPDAWQPAANNHSYRVIASYTDKYKSHVASYTEIRVSNSPTITFKPETAQYNKKYYSKTTSAPIINLNFTVDNLDSEDEIKHESGNLTGIKWYYTNVTTGVTTSFTPSRVNDRTDETTQYPNYWYQFAGQTAGTYTYKVEVELETGIVGSNTITPVCINQIPTAGSVEMTIGSPIQGNIYRGTDDLTFSVTENDEDADDMPTFKWEAIKDSVVVQTETHTYTPTGTGLTYQKLTGATSVTDTFKWSKDVTLANIGSYTVRVTITDSNGPAHSEQVVAEKEVVRDFPIEIDSFNGPDYIYPAGTNTAQVYTATVKDRTASTLNSSFTFGDGDNPTTSIIGTIANAGSNITNTIQYNQFSSSVGTKTMLITVSDEYGMVATARKKVYVNAKPTLGTVIFKDSTSAPTTSIETGANFSIESSSNDGDPKDNIKFKLSIDAVNPANYTTPRYLTEKLVTDETTNKTLVLNSTEIAEFSPKSGKYTFALVAEDSYGVSSEKQTAVLTINKLPTVSFTASPSSSEKYDGKDAFLEETSNKLVNFTATVSDTESEDYTYSWFSGVTSIFAGPSLTKTSLTDSQNFTITNVGMASYSVIVKDPLEETAIATKSFYVFRKIPGTNDAEDAVKDIVTNVQDNFHHYFVFVNGDLSKTTGAYLYDFPTDTSIVVPSSYIASYSDVSQDRVPITADTWTPNAVCAAVRPNGNLVTYATDPSHNLYIYNLNMTAVAGSAPTASGTRITTGPTVVAPSPDKSFAKIAASDSQIWGWVSNSDKKIYKISESGIVTETSREHDDVTNMRAFGDYLYVVAGGSVTKYNASSLNQDAGGPISITDKVIVDIYDATNHYFLLTKDGHIYIYRKSDKTTTDLDCSTPLGEKCKSLCFFTTSDGGYLLALGETKLCAVSLGLPVNGSSLSTW